MKKVEIIRKDDKHVIKSDSKIGRAIFLSILKTRDMIEEKNVKEVPEFKFRAPLFYTLDVQQNDGQYRRFLIGPNVFLDAKTLDLYRVSKVIKDIKPNMEINIDFELEKCCISKIEDCMLNLVDTLIVENNIPYRMQVCASDLGPIDALILPSDDIVYYKRWKNVEETTDKLVTFTKRWKY